jgi:hypothetical protein
VHGPTFGAEPHRPFLSCGAVAVRHAEVRHALRVLAPMRASARCPASVRDRISLPGAPYLIGGTSAVGPLWAGLIALLNQKIGAPVGFLQPLLYGNAEVLRDIVDGTNGAYTAGPRCDAGTGLGTPNGAELEKFLAS